MRVFWSGALPRSPGPCSPSPALIDTPGILTQPFVSVFLEMSLLPSLETIRKKDTQKAGVYWRQSRSEASKCPWLFQEAPINRKDLRLYEISVERVPVLSSVTDSLWTHEWASQRNRLKYWKKVKARRKLG